MGKEEKEKEHKDCLCSLHCSFTTRIDCFLRPNPHSIDSDNRDQPRPHSRESMIARAAT